MRAIAYQAAGPAHDVLEVLELPDPQPAAGEVRVRIHTSAVNPTDVKRRLAETPPRGPLQVPHQDGSGVIDMVGEAVSSGRIGERVWVYHAAHDRAFGTAAEFVCLPAAQAVPLPDSVTLTDASLVGIPFMTAAHALSLAGDLDGASVLITGGAGAVGSAAISLARHAGAEVTATVSSPVKEQLAQKAGSHRVLRYTSGDWTTQLAEHAYDAVIDVALGTNLPNYLPYLRRGAHVVSYSSDGNELHTSVRPLMFVNATLHFFVIYLLDAQALDTAVKQVCKALDAGIRPMLPVQHFDVTAGAEAHDFVEKRELGRAAIDFASEHQLGVS